MFSSLVSILYFNGTLWINKHTHIFFGGSNNHSVSYQIINFHKHNNKSEHQWHHHNRIFLWVFKSFFFFFWFDFIFKLYNIVLVLPNIEMDPSQVYMCSPSWALLTHPSPYHPSGLSQCTSPKHPVSCIEPGLVTHFIHDIIHVSMPFSQIFPPSPSPTESIRLFYTSVSLLLSRTQVYCYHLSKFHIYVLVYCIGVFLSGLLHSV